jgi:hypothetical protein
MMNSCLFQPRMENRKLLDPLSSFLVSSPCRRLCVVKTRGVVRFRLYSTTLKWYRRSFRRAIVCKSCLVVFFLLDLCA